MRIIIFALVFAVLIALSSFAEGLEVTKIDARVDYDYSTTYRLEQEQKLTRVNYAAVPLQNGSIINAQVYPGANLTFTITIENTFQDATKILRDVSAGVTMQGKHGETFEEFSGGFDLEAGTEGKADVKINVPFDIDSGANNILIEVEGTGKNHSLHKIEFNLKLSILKLSHDIRITNVSLEPSIVDCKRKFQLSAEIANAGQNAENQIALEFKSSSLGVDSYEKDILLATSNDDAFGEIIHKKTLNAEVPSFFKSGTYPIYVNLYWKNFILFDQKTIYLTVKDCRSGLADTKTQQEIKNETSVAVIQPAEQTKENQIDSFITRTKEMSILDSPVLFSLLLGGVFLLLILAALIVFVLVRRSRAQ